MITATDTNGDLITLEKVRELYEFLQGSTPKSVNMPVNHPKMSSKRAYNVIWFLQEHLRVLPDHFECCDNCGELFDNHAEGTIVDTPYKGKRFFCGGCDYLLPFVERT